MRYLALATDYDGTIAHHSRVDEPTRAALKRMRETGRKIILVTGRMMSELREVCPHLDLFERIVAENGALLYDPATKEEKVLAEPPPRAFIESLLAQGVDNVAAGRVIVATWEPFENRVLEVIRNMGLELQVIFNKGAVMVLPSGVNKATGLTAALRDLGLSPHNCVAVGDAENDHAFMALCECSAAVANALPAVKKRADIVTQADHGAGVAELVDRILADDLASTVLTRHHILLGKDSNDRDVAIEPFGVNILVAGSSGSGKSTLTTGLLERLHAAGYQYLIVDPEGDYETIEQAVTLGDPHRPPLVEEVLDLLKSPASATVVNLLGVALDHRPAFLDSLLPRLQEYRAKTGRPHWIVVDEAHHFHHVAYGPVEQSLPKEPEGMLFITVHPETVAKSIIESIDVLIAVGKEPAEAFRKFCEVTNRTMPQVDATPLQSGEAMVWWPASNAAPIRVITTPPKAERKRHSRKYAQGNLGPDNSFYFRGPDEKLNLKAHNLSMFLQIAEGVDDETWMFHLRAHEYSVWFREKVKDESLAEEVEEVERDADTAASSRKAIRSAVESRYTLTSDNASGMVSSDGREKANWGK